MLSPTPTARVFQIFFREEQREHLDPSFTPFDNSKNRFPEQMEYRVFLENYERGVPRNPAFSHVGFVSWKFNQKTKITGAEFLRYMQDKPGADVYFINPFPSQLKWTNVWLQGEHFHPGLLNFTQSILKRTGYSIDLRAMVNDNSSAAYCNYWLGNSNFWDKYISFTKPIYDYLINEATDAEKAFLWQPADRKIKASYFPFIFERMFSTLLSTDSSILARSYQYPDTPLQSRVFRAIKTSATLPLRSFSRWRNEK